ncbi:ADM_collapsed_G0050150.mRNA.1.CDS.1 [Saccharomyces cerevisiae]|nr:ADM_collapsed_G0050150.mRNA.1.CDS.1 [Saccharomyces cerevisiae]
MIIINFAFPDNLKLTCEDGGKNPDGTCEFANGHDVLVSYGLVRNTQKYLGIIVCVAIIYRLIAFFILKAKLEWIKW